jgi:hypothetical protein
MLGLAVFGGGAAWFVAIAGTGSQAVSFLLPLAVAGAGMGLIFAPMTTVAMRQITPAWAAAASGVLNTTRQLGAVLLAAVARTPGVDRRPSTLVGGGR